ncbi:MAG: hypothetical protein ACYTBX_10880 [Planctomycetota bacterium]|jgi:hypothetical protein
MYKIFMLIALPLLAIGWIAYAVWMRKIREEEENQPRQVSERLQQTRSEVSDWAQKLKDFKKPTRKPPDQDNAQ